MSDRSLTSLWPHRERRRHLHADDVVGQFAVRPDLLAGPTNGVSYAVSIQTPQRDVDTMAV